MGQLCHRWVGKARLRLSHLVGATLCAQLTQEAQDDPDERHRVQKLDRLEILLIYGNHS